MSTPTTVVVGERRWVNRAYGMLAEFETHSNCAT